ncbi:MAG: TAT-variant-translocated molybdopterin oxidoreductase [Planctomycetaceae bacterium]|nr:TAT-variant-translocated molybdopterin oxidoreductase [Planctomycetaceae bacterium]
MRKTTGKNYWRSLDELHDTPQFREFVEREFPTAASELPEGLSRRRWMQLMGASFALGGLAGCRWEAEKIAPFAVRPEHRIPGEAEKFATTVEIASVPRHLLVTSYDGRPVKVEGNADHPHCQGGTDSFSQAAILGLYDPDRSDSLLQQQGREIYQRSWADFDRFLSPLLDQHQQEGGSQLGFLFEPTSSRAFGVMLSKILKRFPAAKLFDYSPFDRTNETLGSQLAFEQPRRSILRLDRANVVACFDADLLGEDADSVFLSADFASRRDPADSMNRLYVAESQFSTTGVAADHRLPLRSADIGDLLVMLDFRVRYILTGGAEASIPTSFTDSVHAEQFVDALARDLVGHRGNSLIAVGSRQPAEVHALAHSINQLLGSFGKTIDLVEDPLATAGVGTISGLVQQISEGQVDTLFVLGGNPVYDAPADLRFGQVLSSVSNSIHLSVYRDETSRECQWHLPQAHVFESWGDSCAWDGTASVSQPLISPLMNGRSSIEILAAACGDRRDSQEIVYSALSDLKGGFSRAVWLKTLHDGFLEDTASKTLSVSPEDDLHREEILRRMSKQAPMEPETLELVFTRSESVLDGRFANNGWLQETPAFLTKLTWDNAAIISPATAQETGVEHGAMIRLKLESGEVDLPAFVLPGQAKNSIGVAVGYGRTAAGHVGGSRDDKVSPVGIDVYPIRDSRQLGFAKSLEIKTTNRRYDLATTQDHHSIDTVGFQETGRRVGELVRESTLAEYRKDPAAANHGSHHNPLESLWTEKSYDDHAWGMAIDLNKCVGCNACLVACQAENNVPIVGKDQVAKGREMHWLRIDRYFVGDVDQPQVATQPVACHHCENAPCEQVCPVAATVHSDEGLNDMVYNRCIGTRYCANNCPYKVRRFNFFDNNEKLEEPNRQLAQLVINPEVTVRSRGVMEKCTYCVQRIQKVKIDAKNSQRPIRDGEIVTACQEACPSHAIEFGDLNDPKSRVAKAHHDPRAYGMLEELNVKPRTKYLARVRNPNPALVVFENSRRTTHGSHHGHR